MPRYAALCSIAAKLQPLGFVDGNLAMLQHILCDEIRDFCQIFRHKRTALVAAVAAGAGGAVIVEAERERLIDAEWEGAGDNGGQYLAELKMYAHDRQGLLMDISKIFTEAKLDVKSMNVRTSKKGTATLDMGFIVHGRDELNRVIDKLRQVEGVLDIERTAS